MFYDRSGIKVKLLSVPSESDFRGVAASLSGHYGVGGDEGTSPLTVFEAMKSELEKPTFAMTNFEPLMFKFSVDNVSRTLTHQLVRTRIGAGYSQESFRILDVRNRDFRIPATICGTRANAEPAKDYSRRYDKVCQAAAKLYGDMVDDGIPFQDARFVMPMGVITSIIVYYSYNTLYSVSKRRMCKGCAQWEINCVVRMMKECLMGDISEFTPIDSLSDRIIKLLGGKLSPPCNGGRCSNNEMIFPSCGRTVKLDETLYSNDVNANYFSGGDA